MIIYRALLGKSFHSLKEHLVIEIIYINIYLWYFHWEIRFLGKSTRISGNHINLEMKTIISYKYRKGFDCKNCTGTQAYNKYIKWVYFAAALESSPKHPYTNWNKSKSKGFWNIWQYFVKLITLEIVNEWSLPFLYYLVPPCFFASAESFYKISTQKKKKKKGYLLILTTNRHNQQQVKGLHSHLWHQWHAVEQVLMGRPGASRLWKASSESTSCREVQAGLYTLPPTIYFHF